MPTNATIQLDGGLSLVITSGEHVDQNGARYVDAAVVLLNNAGDKTGGAEFHVFNGMGQPGPDDQGANPQDLLGALLQCREDVKAMVAPAAPGAKLDAYNACKAAFTADLSTGKDKLDVLIAHSAAAFGFDPAAVPTPPPDVTKFAEHAATLAALWATIHAPSSPAEPNAALYNEANAVVVLIETLAQAN